MGRLRLVVATGLQPAYLGLEVRWFGILCSEEPFWRLRLSSLLCSLSWTAFSFRRRGMTRRFGWGQLTTGFSWLPSFQPWWSPESSSVAGVRKNKTPQRVVAFDWLALSGSIVTTDNLRKRTMTQHSIKVKKLLNQ